MKDNRKDKTYNKPPKGGKLSKDGLIYKNDLLSTDFTSQTGPVKKNKRG